MTNKKRKNSSSYYGNQKRETKRKERIIGIFERNQLIDELQKQQKGNEKKIYQKEYCRKNKKKIQKTKKRWERKNREKCRERKRKWFERNKEKVKRKSYLPFYIFTILKRTSIKKNYLGLISRDKFVEWYNSQEKVCVYCGIKTDELKDYSFHSTIEARRLSIDRIDNSKGYLEGNLALACLFCNFIKRDIFTYDEMKEIGQIIRRKREKIMLKLATKIVEN